MLEAVIAIAVIGVMLTPLFILQGTVFQNVSRISDRIHGNFFALGFLYETRKAVKENVRQFTLEKKEDDPVTILKYTLGPVDAKSSLHAVPGLLREYVQLTIQERGRQRTDAIITFMYKPERKKQ